MAYPWEYEPDQMYWVHKDSGYHCEVRRNHAGTWCGYVEVPGGHPWFGLAVEDVPALCHGGVTYAGPGKHGGWAIGFDCGHYFDFSPEYSRLIPGGRQEGVYRDIIYVARECRKLALQARKEERE